jgi:micrococcal nuclease
VRPSRIRRDPVPVAAKRRVRTVSPELEMWGGIAGVLLFAGAIAVAVIGVSVATYFKADPAAEAAAAAAEARFGQCYNGGANCVIDGGTIYVGGTKVEIAGMEAPKIQDSKCSQEREAGIDAAVKLVALLNTGKVTVGPTFRDEFGRDGRTVSVKGKDVASEMIRAGVAHKVRAEPQSWC